MLMPVVFTRAQMMNWWVFNFHISLILNTQVLLVTGGYNHKHAPLSSTEAGLQWKCLFSIIWRNNCACYWGYPHKMPRKQSKSTYYSKNVTSASLKLNLWPPRLPPTLAAASSTGGRPATSFQHQGLGWKLQWSTMFFMSPVVTTMMIITTSPQSCLGILQRNLGNQQETSLSRGIGTQPLQFHQQSYNQSAFDIIQSYKQRAILST